MAERQREAERQRKTEKHIIMINILLTDLFIANLDVSCTIQCYNLVRVYTANGNQGHYVYIVVPYQHFELLLLGQ